MAAEGGTVVRGAGEEVVDALRGEEDEPLEVEPRAEVLEGLPQLHDVRKVHEPIARDVHHLSGLHVDSNGRRLRTDEEFVSLSLIL